MLEKRKCKDYYTRYVKRKVSSDDILYNQTKQNKKNDHDRFERGIAKEMKKYGHRWSIQ